VGGRGKGEGEVKKGIEEKQAGHWEVRRNDGSKVSGGVRQNEGVSNTDLGEKKARRLGI
jgi:hypothetical protein